MHELSIATNIVAVALQEATERRVQVEAVHLRLGALTGVVEYSLLLGYKIAAQGTVLEGTRLEIEQVPLTIFCSGCQAQFKLPGIQSLRCPQCNQPSSDIRAGKELEIAAIEIREE